MSKRKILIHKNYEWIETEMKDIKKGDKVKMFEGKDFKQQVEYNGCKIFTAVRDAYYSDKAKGYVFEHGGC